MVVKPFDNRVLDELCSRDQLDLLDSVDRLRSQGIDHYVSLPQIIVCGDQSSGKSSVLEAISGVSFPVKSNLCTRFPTELVLRKTLHVGVSVSIVPDHSHNETERASLSNFRETLDDFHALPDLIETAKKAMAIGSFGRAFSKDLLRIEISGPDRPHLTIVDLPGLIHSETKQQSAADVELVQDVVKSYMKEPRSIILAVVSAKNDYANQVVLKLARAADRAGTRTLGVITKPDTLILGSDSEAMYVSLAQNLDVEFRLGWHVLRNMDSEIGAWSLPKRDGEERHFFSEGIWRTLADSILGIAALRERLSKLLLGQIAAELPSLIEEIEIKSTACRTQLQRLGLPRATIEEQRQYLLTLGQAFQSLTKAAVDGTYNDDFFGNARTEAGYQKRIRAVVQNLNQSFAEIMAREGHFYAVTDSSKDDLAMGNPKVKTIARARYLERVETLMKRTRGCELPGSFNPMIVSDLFLEQSRPWEALAKRHVEGVAQAVTKFLRHLVSHIADSSTGSALFQTLVEPELENIFKVAKRKTADLLAPHRREAELTRIIQDVFDVTSLAPTAPAQFVQMDYRPLLKALMEQTNPDMNCYACSEALDCMQAYYEVAFKRFVDDIAVEAVETNFIARLGDILSPIKVTWLAPEVVTSIAGESDESRAKRNSLSNQLNVLIQGLQTCKKFVVGTLYGTFSVISSMRYHEPAVEANLRLSTGNHDVNIPSERLETLSLDLSSLSLRTESGDIVTDEESEVFEISAEEGLVASSFAETSEPPVEAVYADEADPEPVNDFWGRPTAARSLKKSKKKKVAL
ncbi:GTPase [Ascochyta rabiei]|uniref:GTPase n=1 Tax=Didymella rabiei TaxID=5454 RepID=A0A163BC24_DIDRA|nr:GTPase [Ascochyta rabiei]